MAEKESGFFRGSGGVVWEMDLPLRPLMGEQLARQELVRVNEDGSTYAGPPTPIAGGMVMPVDERDAEIVRLRARLAELEAVEPETDADVERAAGNEGDTALVRARRPRKAQP